MKATITWTDQEWGYEKGHVRTRISRAGKVIEESNLQTRCDRSLGETIDLDTQLLSEHFQRGDEIHVEFFVGGGGGHEIHVKKIALEVVVTPDDLEEATKRAEMLPEEAREHFKGLLEANNDIIAIK